MQNQTQNKISQLRHQNQLLTKAITNRKMQELDLQNKFQIQISNFISESKRTLETLNQNIMKQSQEKNKMVQQLTSQYQAQLQKQIQFLKLNKTLAEQKSQREKQFNTKVQNLSATYESKIEQMELVLKSNLSTVNQMQGHGAIKVLLDNPRFKAEIVKRGGDPQRIAQQHRIQQIAKEIDAKESEIVSLEQNNKQIDSEVDKMEQMIDTFQKLVENINLQKNNLAKQNQILETQLAQFQGLINH